MASGDTFRTWFPEMVEALKAEWSSDMPWPDVIALCARMTEMRARIRDERGIVGPRCPCGQCDGRMEPTPITVRSALFALKKARVIDGEELATLDKAWQKYQRKNRLTGSGQEKGAAKKPQGHPRRRSEWGVGREQKRL